MLTVLWQAKSPVTFPLELDKHVVNEHHIIWSSHNATRKKYPHMVYFNAPHWFFYVNEILEKTILPFIESRFSDGHRFQQDNNPKHTSRLAQAFMDRSGINWWKTPPESPDLNPIELIWHELKHFLRTNVKPTMKDELLGRITRFWQERMTPEKCTTYINQKVVPLVVQRGRASGH